MSLTFISAIYDIGREKYDGRSMSDYKIWLALTLRTLTNPMVLYMDNTLGWKEEMMSIRGDIGPLTIIETPLSEICMWKYKDQIEKILNNPEFKKIQTHPNDVTNLFSGYCMIQYSKFGFIEDVIRKNPYNTQYFSWADAGVSRFYDTAKKYTFLNNVQSSAFHIQAEMNRLSLLNGRYIGTNECIFHGKFWVFDAASFFPVKEEVFRILEEEMIQKGILDNEQIALALAYKYKPHLFALIPTKPYYIDAFSIFSTLFAPVS